MENADGQSKKVQWCTVVWRVATSVATKTRIEREAWVMIYVKSKTAEVWVALFCFVLRLVELVLFEGDGDGQPGGKPWLAQCVLRLLFVMVELLVIPARRHPCLRSVSPAIHTLDFHFYIFFFFFYLTRYFVRCTLYFVLYTLNFVVFFTFFLKYFFRKNLVVFIFSFHTFLLVVLLFLVGVFKISFSLLCNAL